MFSYVLTFLYEPQSLHINRTFSRCSSIIGILAAVDVVAYNVYTGDAKVYSSKTNHNNVVKKVALTIQEWNC